MADLNEIVDTLSGLTVIEAAELSTLLEEKWGVSAAAPVAVAAAADQNETSCRTTLITKAKHHDSQKLD